MKRDRNRILKVTAAFLVALCFVGVCTALVSGKPWGEPSVVPITGEDVFLEVRHPGVFQPIGEYMYVRRRVSVWQTDCSDDRMDGILVVRNYGLFDPSGIPLYMWGTAILEQDGKPRWRFTWMMVGLDDEGNSILKCTGYGVGPYWGLRMVGTYTVAPMPTDGSPWIETLEGFIIDLYGRH